MSLNTIALYIVGTDLISTEGRPYSDKDFIAQLHDFASKDAFAFFSNLAGVEDFGSALEVATTRWNQAVGILQKDDRKLAIFRLWPDWCISLEIRPGNRPDDLFVALDRCFGSRYLDGPARILVNCELPDEVPDTVVPVGAAGDILLRRTSGSYLGSVYEELSSTVSLSGVQVETLKTVCDLLLVLEYDVRAIKRDLLDLRRTRSEVEVLARTAHTLYTEFMYSNASTPTISQALRTKSEVLSREIRTYSSDVFTTVHDLESYASMLHEVLSIGDGSGLLDWYRDVAVGGYRRAAMLQAEMARLREFVTQLDSI